MSRVIRFLGLVGLMLGIAFILYYFIMDLYVCYKERMLLLFKDFVVVLFVLWLFMTVYG